MIPLPVNKRTATPRQLPLALATALEFATTGPQIEAPNWPRMTNADET
jgi:hypothetical protein